MNSQCCSGVSRGQFVRGSCVLPLGTLLLSFSLTGPPYKPLQTVDECFLAHKTLFLLVLASAKRVGELQALSFRVSHSEDWSEVSFRFVPGIVAKTQDASSNNRQFEGFSVPGLPKSSTNPNSRLLCLVRAVRCYLARTAPHCP